MTDKEKREKFVEDFYKKYPDYELIEFTLLGSPIIFKDSKGHLHKKHQAKRVLSFGHKTQSLINPFKYAKDELKQIFPDLRLLEYNGRKKKCLVQNIDGFKYSPHFSDLLHNHPPSIQTCTDKFGLFCFKANLVHDDFYTYKKFIYKNGKQKITITCPLHGDFKQMVEGHLFGNGCKRCGTVGFSKESWMNRLKDKTAMFYILQLSSGDEKFIKVGITSKTIERRYRYIENYTYKILDFYKGDPSLIYDLEKEFIKKFKKFKHVPKENLQGHTECFNLKVIDKYERFRRKKFEY